MQTPALFEHIEMCGFVLSIETNAHKSLAHTQVSNEEFRQPVRQMRVEQQQIGESKRIQAQHRLQNREHARRRPCLRPVCLRIKRRKGVLIIARMATEAFGKAVVIEEW